MVADLTDRAGKAARDVIAADLDAAFNARSSERRAREAAETARRVALLRAGKAAQSAHLIAMPRMAALMKAAMLLGGAKVLAQALGIADRTLRAKTSAERGVTDADLRAAAAALDARAEQLTAHATKLRQEADGNG